MHTVEGGEWLKRGIDVSIALECARGYVTVIKL